MMDAINSLRTISPLLLVLLVSCSGSAGTEPDGEVVPKGDRVLAIDLTQGNGESYDDAVARSLSVGATAFSLSIGWNSLETSPGRYEPSVDLLGIANSYYPAFDAPIALMIGPVDTNNELLPDDLKGKPYDDPAVIARFNQLLDYLFSRIPDLDLSILAIGNEVDILFGTDTARWGSYRRFLQAVLPHARSLRPGLKVSVKITAASLTGPMKESALSLFPEEAPLLLTYYPLKNDFTVRSPSVVADDFDEMVDAAEGRSIWLMESGYPSSDVCNSSEEQQGEFVRNVFHAWDKHAEQIEYLSFSIMTDRSEEETAAFGSYYGISDPRFLEYLRTLGLRTWEGEEKVGWNVLRSEAGARGFY